jgi:5-methylcytosine-specific restriction protein B
LPSGVQVTVAQQHGREERSTVAINSENDLHKLSDFELIDVARRVESTEPVLYEPSFTDEVKVLFQQLYPLYRFITTDDPELLGKLVDEGDDIEGIEPQELYTLDHLFQDTYLDETFWSRIEILLEDKKQIIFYGPPGTGKTWVAKHFAQYWVDSAVEADGEVRVVQFHPTYAYEEFVEGIRPQSVPSSDGHHQLSYPVKKGVFRKFCEEARGHPNRRYVLVIDEINRGELPRILGELLYLLEYRKQSITLPYSGEEFAIPDNVYLVGTMNTADRSIAMVDHALRRRFHFIQMRPDSSLLRDYYQQRAPELLWLADLVELLNQKLEEDGIEWHLHIGHSHFMDPSISESRLDLIWKYSIMPTLEEYFYRDREKLDSYKLTVLKSALGTL